MRCADDRNTYVRSERSGQRVMASVTRFIERRLRLKVNQEKSAVARPEKRHVVGFSLRRELQDGTVEVLLAERSKCRLAEKVWESGRIRILCRYAETLSTARGFPPVGREGLGVGSN